MTERAGITGFAVCLFVASLLAMLPPPGSAAEPLWPRLMKQSTLPKASYRESFASPTVSGPDGGTVTVSYRSSEGRVFYHYLPKGEYAKTMAMIRRFGGVQLFQAGKGACGAGFYVADNLATSSEYGARYLLVFPASDGRIADVTRGEGARALSLVEDGLRESHPRLAKKAKWNALAEGLGADALYYDEDKGWMNWFNRGRIEAVVGSEDALAWARETLADSASSGLRKAAALVEILRRPDEALSAEEEGAVMDPALRSDVLPCLVFNLEGLLGGAGDAEGDEGVIRRFRDFFAPRGAWLLEGLQDGQIPCWPRVLAWWACHRLALPGLDEGALGLVEDSQVPLDERSLARLLLGMAEGTSPFDDGQARRLLLAMENLALSPVHGPPLARVLHRVPAFATALDPLLRLVEGSSLAPRDRLELLRLASGSDPDVVIRAMVALLPDCAGDAVAFDACVRALVGLGGAEAAGQLADLAGLVKGPQALKRADAVLLARCLHDAGAEREAVGQAADRAWLRVRDALLRGEAVDLEEVLRKLAPCRGSTVAGGLIEILDHPACASEAVGLAALELFLMGDPALAPELVARAEAGLPEWPRLPFWLAMASLGVTEAPDRFLAEARRVGAEHQALALQGLESSLLAASALAAILRGIDETLTASWWLHEFLSYAIADRRRGEAEGAALALLMMGNGAIDEEARSSIPYRLGVPALTAYWEERGHGADPTSISGAVERLQGELTGFAEAWERLKGKEAHLPSK